LRKFIKIVSLILCVSIISCNSIVYAANTSKPDSIGDEVYISFLFAFFRDEPSISSKIKNVFWYKRNVKVLDYSGNYIYVRDVETKEKGYIHELLLNDKSLNIVQEYLDVYKGNTKEKAITVNTKPGKNFDWSLSKNGIVEITQYSEKELSVKGLSSGMVTLTIKCDGEKDTCIISCVEKWYETETVTADETIQLMGSPGTYYDNAPTVSKGSPLIARGNVFGKDGYIYVTSGSKSGHMKLSDFPGIDYLMIQFHYYDKGYELRFNDKGEKINEYASVLDNIMMANFKLKVVSSVDFYTSVADECKIESYGSVKPNNLAESCPRTGDHLYNYCLTTENMRDDLEKQFGDGYRNISKAAWTGHIMSDHEGDRPNATIGMGTVVITPYARVSSNNYSNLSSSKIKEESIYTLVHETGHQFGLQDHYCANNKIDNNDHCSNNYCSECNGEPIPYGCLMYDRPDINNSTLTKLYCDDCKEDILDCIKKF